MEIEIAAVITIAPKLEFLDGLLEKRIDRAALDTVTPALKILEKVYELGEYRRLAANLAVMEHRLRFGLEEGGADEISDAARSQKGKGVRGKRVRKLVCDAKKILASLGIDCAELEKYKKLPLYRAECRKLERIDAMRTKPQRVKKQATGAAHETTEKFTRLYGGAEFAPSPVGKTLSAL